MSKHKTKEEWISLFKNYEKKTLISKEMTLLLPNVSYIPTKTKQHLSLCGISHKAKLVEAWERSKKNDNELVIS